MKAESTIRPASPFEIENNGEMSTVKLYANIQEKQETTEQDEVVTKYVYDEYRLEVPTRTNLEDNVGKNYNTWLNKAIEKENEPKPETEREKVARLEKENHQLGTELSQREIEGIIQGQQISDLEIQILQLQAQGGAI